MRQLNFVCFKWKPPSGYRSQFGPATVNTLHRMIARHYPLPFDLICVTDDARGIEPHIRTVKLWSDHANLPSPHGPGYPSCYRRLKMFSSEAAALFGPRFVSLDLDVVICSAIAPLFDNELEFKIYGDTAKGTPYNGSLILHTAGTRRQLWERFDPLFSPRLGISHKYIGSDQAWIAACLGGAEPKFSAADGVYSFRNEIEPKGGALPKDARIVIMHGHVDPWMPLMQARYPWIREHYR